MEADGRNETALERCDRNLVELLQEVRVVQTGVQVLFAFLLTAPLAARFPTLTAFQQRTYFVTLLVTGAAAILLIAPTAHHRILFRMGDKEHLVVVANRFMLAGLGCVALSLAGAVLLVTDVLFGGTTALVATVVVGGSSAASWFAGPLRRRGKLSQRRSARHARPKPIFAASSVAPYLPPMKRSAE
jgi:hypothetical protein